MDDKILNDAKNAVLGGEILTTEMALEIALNSDLQALCATANEIREKSCGAKFNLCTIVNVKSGKCSENCAYCAQSVHFNTGCDTHGILGVDEILKTAKENESAQTHRFSLVASGRGVFAGSKDLGRYCEIYSELGRETKLHLCASFGLADVDALKKLKASGVQTYHHNLETSRKFYHKICTTHSYQDRIDTCKNAVEAGLDLCCGGIFGLGESMEDRIEMAQDIRALGATSVPINILTPIAGTPLQSRAPLSTDEILRSIAIFRFLLPSAYLRFAGGRKGLGTNVKTALKGGINSALTGNFLTTLGDTIESDKALVMELGFDLALGDDRRE